MNDEIQHPMTADDLRAGEARFNAQVPDTFAVDTIDAAKITAGTLAVAPDVHSNIVELELARRLPRVLAGHPVVVAPGSILHFMDEDGSLMRIVADEAGVLSKARAE